MTYATRIRIACAIACTRMLAPVTVLWAVAVLAGLL